jgi:hypothetical protein
VRAALGIADALPPDGHRLRGFPPFGAPVQPYLPDTDGVNAEIRGIGDFRIIIKKDLRILHSKQ